MFDRIAGSYDFLNRLLSFRRDIAWRRRLKNLLPERDNLQIIDLATGTGDALISLLHNNKRIKLAVGLDPSWNMLRLGQAKLAAADADRRAALVRADGARTPFKDHAFDAVTIAFGIRNMLDIPGALMEMRRVLKPGGRVLIMELTRPENRFVRRCYFFYLRHVVPAIGCVISGDGIAYRYLNSTIERFLSGVELRTLMEGAGFERVDAIPLTLGIVSIFRGDSAFERHGEQPRAAAEKRE